MRADWTSEVCPALGTDCNKKVFTRVITFLFYGGNLHRPQGKPLACSARRAEEDTTVKFVRQPRRAPTQPVAGSLVVDPAGLFLLQGREKC